MARKTTKIKTTATPAAQSRDEAEAMIGRIGEISRELTRQDADLGDALALAKQKAEAVALPLKDELESLKERVQRWAEANRDDLTRAGKTKTAEFTTGTVSWRLRPPSVTIRGGVDNVIAWLKANLEGRFIRTKEELDKEALRSAPEIAVTVPGVKLGSAGEDFVIEPFGGELAEAV